MTQDWEWSTIPSVTATAKPAASPIAGSLQGGEAGDEFSTRLVSTGQVLTQDRFMTALKAGGWQFLGSDQTGDPPDRPGRKPARSTNAVTPRAGSWLAALKQKFAIWSAGSARFLKPDGLR